MRVLISTVELSGIGSFARSHSGCRPKTESKGKETYVLTLGETYLLLECSKCGATHRVPFLEGEQ